MQYNPLLCYVILGFVNLLKLHGFVVALISGSVKVTTYARCKL